jgi:hypothetical protein
MKFLFNGIRLVIFRFKNNYNPKNIWIKLAPDLFQDYSIFFFLPFQ